MTSRRKSPEHVRAFLRALLEIVRGASADAVRVLSRAEATAADLKGRYDAQATAAGRIEETGRGRARGLGRGGAGVRVGLRLVRGGVRGSWLKRRRGEGTRMTNLDSQAAAVDREPTGGTRACCLGLSRHESDKECRR